MKVRDVAFGERDDVDAGEGEALEETGCIFLVAAEAVQRLGEDDIKSTVQSCLARARTRTRGADRRCPVTGDCALGGNESCFHDHNNVAPRGCVAQAEPRVRASKL